MRLLDLTLGSVCLDRLPEPLEADRYGSPGGEIMARQSLADWWKVDVRELCIVAGASMGLTCALMTLRKPGKILIPRPHFPLYPRLVDLAQRQYECYDIEPNIDLCKLETQLRDNVAAIILNWPHNPTGQIPRQEDIDALAKFARKNNVEIIADEAYVDFVYDDQIPQTQVLVDSGLLTRIRSGSKLLQIPGERLGAVIASTERVFQITQAHWTLAMSPPATAQRIAIEKLSSSFADAHKTTCSRLRRRRDLLRKELSNCPWLEANEPQAGIFLWATCSPSIDMEKLTRCCRESNLAVSNGSAFGASTPNIRLSFALPKRILRQGAERLCNALEEAANNE